MKRDIRRDVWAAISEGHARTKMEVAHYLGISPGRAAVHVNWLVAEGFLGPDGLGDKPAQGITPAAYTRGLDYTPPALSRRQKAYYVELARAVVEAANCLQYDNAARLLRLGCDYGPSEKKPEPVLEAWSEMGFYENYSSEEAELPDDLDPHEKFFEPAIKRLEVWLKVSEVRSKHEDQPVVSADV